VSDCAGVCVREPGDGGRIRREGRGQCLQLCGRVQGFQRLHGGRQLRRKLSWRGRHWSLRWCRNPFQVSPESDYPGARLGAGLEWGGGKAVYSLWKSCGGVLSSLAMNDSLGRDRKEGETLLLIRCCLGEGADWKGRGNPF